jgi:hypothetical protein
LTEDEERRRDEERKREEERRAWLGEPTEHGGEYRPSRAPHWAADAGCCLFEAAAAASVFAALIVLPAWLLLG